MKLTDHLLSLDQASFKKATQHEFLSQVGKLLVKPEHLKSWLIQDRYYTGGYIKMMGLMISRLPLYEEQRDLGDNNPFYTPEKAQAVIKTLSFALSNVYRESQFFTDILSQEPYAQCHQSMKQKPWTARYVDYVRKVANESGYDLGEALVVLWAMEVVFFRAWTFAKQIAASENSKSTLSTHEKTCHRLMENWTLDEFAAFVDDCEALVNQLDTSDKRRLASFERVYLDILALEVEFWNMAYD
ncbi:hypothetical protein A0J61_08324 [Choanephora cucurbitarum]|uniref:Thiaminase-2/PQQC domain-containing protein n=1 Tax=Choanephora cucurbitarum TaxID=101091 RepID=A0A1C7N3G6_9FUNG|nr:hypothetical protein A0J61_08324 [Choanephora cucurbitarum]